MAITEENRHQLYLRLDQVLGPSEASTLMGMLPSVGWADVATKQDLAQFELVFRRDLELLEERLRAFILGEVSVESTARHEDLAGLRVEMVELRDGLRGEMAGLRVEMVELRSELRGEMAGQRAEMAQRFHAHLVWTVAAMGTMLGVMFALLKFT